MRNRTGRRHAVAMLVAAAVVLSLPGSAAASTCDGSACTVTRDAGGGLGVPIVMYHYVRVNPNPRDVLGAHLSVAPALFAEEMALLRLSGHRPMTVDDLVADMSAGTSPPPGAVVLTFDDGYSDFATQATPIMVSLGMHGTDYVVAGFTDRPGFMTRRQLVEVTARGMSIGAHTMHHVDLAGLSDDSARAEIGQSGDLLRQWTGQRVRSFAYPYGAYNSGTPWLVANSGFDSAVATDGGSPETMSGRYTLHRVRADGFDTLAGYARKLGISLPPQSAASFWQQLDGLAAEALRGPTTGIAATPSGHGYLLADHDGLIHPYGDAVDRGGMAGRPLNLPVVGIAATPTGRGYWLVASDGGIFPLGDAGGYGSTGGIRLNLPVVGMTATTSGRGYWLVASDGGVFPFGAAGGYGSTGNIHLNQPVVGMAATPSGRGYWLVAADGGIFPFGDARGYGSTGNIRLNEPMVGMAATPDGHGYWLVASDGGVFPFGNARGYGSTGGIQLSAPIVGAAATPDGRGYWLVGADGGIFPFGDAGGYGSAAAPDNAPPPNE